MAERLRTLIVDDEPLAVERLQILCARIDALNLVGTAMEGASALRLVETLAPDLILLDIQMPVLDGVALAHALAARTQRPHVIFITAFDQFAVEAFDVGAVDYLLKPVELPRLERAVARIQALAPSGAEAAPVAAKPWTREFWVPHRSEVIRIAAGDIELIEAERDYMRLHVGARSFLLHETISGLESKLDPAQFVRLHRSTLVRRNCIAGLRHNGTGAWEVQIAGGRWLRVGRTYLASVRAMTET